MGSATMKEETSLCIERIYDATPEEVFDAWIDPDTLRLWFTCGSATHVSAMEIDGKRGGSYRIVMSNETEDWLHEGDYLEFDRPSHLQFTWRTTYEGDRKSVVDVRIEAVKEGTKLTLHHDVLIAESVEPHTKGWTELLDKLEKALG